MIKYGLISETDARCLEKTIDLICDGFPMDKGASHFHPSMDINVCEIGIYSGDTGRGICKYIKSKMRNPFITGIDNNKDGQQNTFFYNQLIIGNSVEVYNQIPDESQHLILIDGNHSFPYVISDYYCYKNKVKTGGFLCFHDASPQAQGKDWQRMGDEKDPDMSISVTKALFQIGLIDKVAVIRGWEKIFWEWDENDNCGGMIVFKKLYK